MFKINTHKFHDGVQTLIAQNAHTSLRDFHKHFDLRDNKIKPP